MSKLSKKTLFAVGRPLGPIYSQAMKFRALLYRNHIFKSHSLAVPVISVGNLTMGGTGKTPLVIYLAKLLKEIGHNPAVVSRGYRGTARQPVNIISDGSSILMSAEAAGDEPFLIASSIPGIVVATGRKRISPCREAIETYGCDTIILDDGFQHLSVTRNIDLVLFDVDHFAGNSRVFPGGDLREPISALKRCSAFLLTGITPSNQKRADKCRKLLNNKFPEKPVFPITRAYSHGLKYTPVSSGFQQESIALSKIPHDLFCFCGIANPGRFRELINEYAIGYTGFETFEDHHEYSEQDVTRLNSKAASTSAQGFLTTEKDISKMRPFIKGNLPFYTPVLEIPRNQQLNDFILAKIGSPL